jgi:hypothetical protein
VFRGKSKVAGVQHIGILTGYAQDVVVRVEMMGLFKWVSFVFCDLVGLFFLSSIYAGCAGVDIAGSGYQRGEWRVARVFTFVLYFV